MPFLRFSGVSGDLGVHLESSDRDHHDGTLQTGAIATGERDPVSSWVSDQSDLGVNCVIFADFGF